METQKIYKQIMCIAAVLACASSAVATEPDMASYANPPLFLTADVPPLVMLVMARDHKLYYEAYNDASDLNEDGVLDVGFNPDIDYYGYFDCYKCYAYDSGQTRFEPSSTTPDKKCTGAWSGNFLNYVTMSRMDCMRKVLYGGYRSTDTSSETVLSRVFVPEDAHSWGKEYKSIERDGYDISEYTPLNVPQSGTYHVFASTTLSSAGPPVMRVLNDTRFRVWEWLSIERPVAGTECSDGTRQSCATAGGTVWNIVPVDMFSGLTQTTYNTTGYGTYPADHAAYDALVTAYATVANRFGSGAATQINGSGNPFSAQQDNYLTIFTGQLNITSAGTYQFAVDGDDAVEVMIDGTLVASWYGGHGSCGCSTHNGSVALTAGLHSIVFRHQEAAGGDNYYLRYGKTVPSSSITDYQVNVVVCDPSMPESSCKQYPAGDYKPIGLLQRHGEEDRMYFGLMTASYAKNTSGGVLRKNIKSIKDEINTNTGQFTAVNGIVKTIDKLKIYGYDYGSWSHNQNCGWVATRAINEGECRMWGEPIGEVMYEALRYFAGKGSPTPDFDYSSGDDVTLGLPKASWTNPYDETTGYGFCAKPFMLVMSDIVPSYDSDKIPGSYFSSFSGDLSGLNAQTLAGEISSEEGINGSYFMGQQGSDYSGSCNEITVNNFGNIRGLCPEEPTKQGSYYSAAVAYFGHTNDLNPAEDDQKVTTYAVGLSSPLPSIVIPVGDHAITMVPFAKSVGGYGISSARGSFQPTNTIVDFYVESLQAGAAYGKFRINYEDVEQGADHDMDAIVSYEYQVVNSSGVAVATPADGVAVDVTLTSEYAAGSIAQHMGYIISGTTADGTYLEVRDCDTANSSGTGACRGNDPSTDPQYFLDTPPGIGPNQGVSDTAWNDGAPLPLRTKRRFTPAGGSDAAYLLKNPLWYVGKWGAFKDKNDNDIPDDPTEWDEDGNGVPDNYYYVTNPLKLEQELNKSFADILMRAGSGTAVSVLATKGEGEGTLVQAYFKAKVPDYTGLNDVLWVGYLQSLWVDRYGNTREDSNHDYQLNIENDAIVEFYLDEDSNETKVKRFAVSAGDPYPDTDNATGTIITLDELQSIWEAGKLLASTDESQRRVFAYIGDGTEPDPNVNMIAFSTVNKSLFQNFLGLEDNAAWDYLGQTFDDRIVNMVNFIRGVPDDSASYQGDRNMRTRTVSIDGSPLVWKLGDIVNSTPMSVSKPVENYGLIYDDDSYRNYFLQYKNRETVVYVGGNDGMLHAFTSGVYRPDQQKFYSIHDPDSMYDIAAIPDTLNIGDIPLGGELWAYIPKCLLPHLKFLPSQEYPHVSYVDLRPKIIDARVFPDDNATHHGGWGTILIGGLNMGGKDITTASAGTLYPSFFAMDITNPRNPQLLWEKTYPNMGFTTNIPCVLSVGSKWTSTEWINGQWYLAITSGPTDYTGASNQAGRVFIVDLATGALLNTFVTTDANSSMNPPVSLDMGMNYNVDAIYTAANYNDGSSWKGRAYRIGIPQVGKTKYEPSFTDYNTNPAQWTMTKLFSSPQPLSAPFVLSVDKKDNSWIYMGTGRYVEQADKTSTYQNYFFGIKDPFYNPDNNTTCYAKYPVVECELDMGDLFAADQFTGKIKAGGTIEGVSGITNYNKLLEEARKGTYRGWYRTLCPGSTDANGTCLSSGPSERALNKPAILGGILLVPTFSPNTDICGYGGTGRMFAVFYETGTAYKNRIVGERSQETILDFISLGEGLSSSFGVHVGKEEGGTLYGQLSTGEIAQIDITPAFSPKSAPIYWRELP